LNQVLLRAPGVVQDGFGQVHVRGDHGSLQYRLDGVQLPEGLSLFSQVLSPRFANSISLLTGALPAQFGLRTAGVVDIGSSRARPIPAPKPRSWAARTTGCSRRRNMAAAAATSTTSPSAIRQQRHRHRESDADMGADP
jgi:hypothetical protein